jgi:hypothetical protein
MKQQGRENHWLEPSALDSGTCAVSRLAE